jgi:cytochrome c5
MRARVKNIRLPLREAVLILILCVAHSAAAQGQGTAAAEDVDHAGIIRSWTDANRARGQRIYDAQCYSCHGYEGALPACRMPGPSIVTSCALEAIRTRCG